VHYFSDNFEKIWLCFIPCALLWQQQVCIYKFSAKNTISKNMVCLVWVWCVWNVWHKLILYDLMRSCKEGYVLEGSHIHFGCVVDACLLARGVNPSHILCSIIPYVYMLSQFCLIHRHNLQILCNGTYM
jgi:hypothetical protein